MESCIEICDLSYVYHDGRQALQDVSLDVRQGGLRVRLRRLRHQPWGPWSEFLYIREGHLRLRLRLLGHQLRGPRRYEFRFGLRCLLLGRARRHGRQELRG